jgi:hypothetical protein
VILPVSVNVEVMNVDRRAAGLEAFAMAGVRLALDPAFTASTAWESLGDAERTDLIKAVEIVIAGGNSDRCAPFDAAVRAAVDVWTACERANLPLRVVTINGPPVDPAVLRCIEEFCPALMPGDAPPAAAPEEAP